MKYYTFVYGCQMNKADSQRAKTVLESLGYEETKEVQEADLVLVLACSIRQAAVDRVFGKKSLFGRLRKSKELITVLSGCVIEEDKKDLSKFFDIILSSAELPQLPNRLNLKKRDDLEIDDYLDLKPKYEHTHSVYVPIMNGCNKFCTYCVVPYTRGREVSRNAQHIIDEITFLLDAGCKEITLLGQNVNSYRDLESGVDFPELVKRIDELEGDFWIRYTSSHPYDMSDRLIEVMKNGKHIANQLHLPVQAGHDELLKRMNRHYSVEHFKKRIQKVREAMPNISVSTDIIIGFCQESEEEFEASRQLFDELKFDQAYISQYSQRKGTKAVELYEDDISKKDKIQREQILEELLQKYALEFNQRMYKGKTVKVLVDKYHEKDGYCYARTEENKHIKFKGDKGFVGKFANVKVLKIDAFHLYGELA